MNLEKFYGLVLLMSLTLLFGVGYLILLDEAYPAEILFIAVNDAAADAAHPAGHYIGQPISIRPDGFAWGAKEIIPPAQGGKFCRIILSGVTVEQVRNKVSDLINKPYFDADGNLLERTRWRVEVGSLPLAVRQNLNQYGYYYTTWTTVRNYVKSRVTGSVLPEW